MTKKKSSFAFFIFAAAFGAVFYFRPDFFPTLAPRERSLTHRADFQRQIEFGIFLLPCVFRHPLKMEQFSYINEEFYASQVTPEQTDLLLAEGWRHFGEHFYRYNLGFYRKDVRAVYALRVNLENFSLSKNQRRVLRNNQDLRIVIRPIEVTEEKEDLFERHKKRFDFGAPDSLFDFLSYEPATVPCEGLEVCAYRENELLAAAFFDVGRATISSVYAMFAPEEPKRSLGILTMLLEIKFAYESGKKFYYHGYAYEGNSFYDYKKRFRALESYDWRGGWKPFVEELFDF